MSLRRTVFLYFIISIPLLTFSQDRLPEAAQQATLGTDKHASRPNIIVILADDLGYGDLGCFGSEHVKTPVLDGLATRGMRFTNFYAGSTVCSPSRATLLTGRNHNRLGVYDWVPAGSPMHLPVGEVTIAEVLGESGYQTAHFGKWHLSMWSNRDHTLINPSLTAHGFDYWYACANNALPSQQNPRNFLLNGKALGTQQGYSCQLLADQAITWLEERRSEEAPFYMQLWFTEPHEVVKAPAKYRDRHLENGMDQKLADYYGCIEHMDNAVGRVVEKIREMGISKETMIVFTSDNGSKHHESNGGLRGKKRYVWEGGIRVPAIFYWDGHIKPNKEITEVCGLADFFPTFCELTGNGEAASLATDGVSLKPVVDGEQFDRGRPVFTFHYFESMASLRQGDWTLIGYLNEPHPQGPTPFRESYLDFIKQAQLGRFELYNIRKDGAQTTDVSGDRIDIAERMKKQMIEDFQETISEGPDWFR